MRVLAVVVLAISLAIAAFSAWTAWDSKLALDALCKEYVERWQAYETQKQRADNILSDIEKRLKRLDRKMGK
ncbi:MAG: hypothetical protein HY895_16805 [Deltaproteobacteria bacterium]|nr:hypothetical protein [Deltaproteobacteria bacterium]